MKPVIVLLIILFFLALSRKEGIGGGTTSGGNARGSGMIAGVNYRMMGSLPSDYRKTQLNIRDPARRPKAIFMDHGANEWPFPYDTAMALNASGRRWPSRSSGISYPRHLKRENEKPQNVDDFVFHENIGVY